MTTAEHNGIAYFFFWGGELSNWYPKYFIVNDVKYNCMEQYMMHQKALFFKDTDIAERILEELKPNRQKYFGRLVKGFNEKSWTKVKYDLVKVGVKAKFEQNPKLLEVLLQYKGMEIVEASPYDRIWGIGYSEAIALDNIDTWGENLLGKILTEVCNELHKKHLHSS